MNSKLLFLGIVMIAFAGKTQAQMTNDTVSTQPGVTNRTFYQMSSGTVSSVSNMDWDLGFQLRGFAASILINSVNNVHLYRAQKDAAEWSSMVASDTSGITDAVGYELFNSNMSWDTGAFNVTIDPLNPFDLGWGVYDLATHAITGDSIYFIRLSNHVVKKFYLESLAGGIYTFKWADVDGSNEITGTLTKSNFQGKYFAYYSLLNNQTIDREPMYNAWDFSFEKYYDNTINYSVAGVLSNDSVSVAKAYPVDTSITSANGFNYEYAINKIGYDWKTYDFGLNMYVVSDSTVYFVCDRQGAYWKIIFTGYSGSSLGEFYFSRGPATVTGIIENSHVQTLGVYPNPAHDNTRLMVDAKESKSARISLVDLTGRTVYNESVHLSKGIQGIDLNLQNMIPGIYQVVIRQGNDLQVCKLMVQ